LGIFSIYLCVGGVPLTVGNFSTSVKFFFQTLPQQEVFMQSYAPPKLQKSQFQEFWDSHLVVLGQNDISVLALWLNIMNNIRRRVVTSPKSGSWWVLWFSICPWFVRAPKVVWLCINQLVVWFVHVCVSN